MPLADIRKQNKNESSPVIDIDYEAVKSVQTEGDPTQFTKLMNKYKNPVFNFCLKYTSSSDDADDIAQEVFIKVYRKIDTFRFDAAFSTWLFRITTNTCKNYSRWRKSRKMDELVRIETRAEYDVSPGLDIKDSRLNPEETFITDELRRVIDEAVNKLNPKQRSAIILKDYLCKSYNEIAEIMKLNPGTVKSTIARGRINIAKQIEDYCNL